MKYTSTVSTAQPTTVETPREWAPLEVAMTSMAACAVAGLGAALFLDRPWPELWRWLLGGLMLPVVLVVVATLARLLTWTLEGVARRDLTGDGVIGQPETIRLLPVRGQSPRIVLSGEDDGYEPADLRALIHHAYAVGHVARSFYGMTLPSGRKLTGYDDVAPFLGMLKRAGLLVDQGQRKSGRLVGTEAETLEAFGL